jgi:HEAT repeat protein
MHKHNPALREEGFFALQPHAREYLPELIAEFEKETDHGLRCWLLELIADAKSKESFPVLVEALRSEDDSLWSYALSGLKKLDTKEARRVLWEARSYTKSSEEKTQQFRNTLVDQEW